MGRDREKALARAIQQSLENRRVVEFGRIEATEGIPTGFRRTRAFDEILRAIALGKRLSANLVLITGQNGGGKTTALRVYAATFERAIYWEARAGYEPKHVLADVVSKLPMNTGEGWRLQTSAAIAYLARSPYTFLIDEAQRLNYNSLDLLKYIADNSGSTFVLSASSSLATRIERWPDISSRCPVRVEVKPMELEEFVELHQAEGWSLEALQEIHRLGRGVMRTMQALFLVLQDHIEAAEAATKRTVDRGEVQPSHIRLIAAGVVPGGADGGGSAGAR